MNRGFSPPSPPPSSLSRLMPAALSSCPVAGRQRLPPSVAQTTTRSVELLGQIQSLVKRKAQVPLARQFMRIMKSVWPYSACQVNGVPTRNVCNKIVLPASASAAAITAAQNKLMGLFPPALNITLEVRRPGCAEGMGGTIW